MSNTPTIAAKEADLAIHPAERLTLRDAWKAPTGTGPDLAQLLADHVPFEFNEGDTAAIVNRATKLLARGDWDALAAVEYSAEKQMEGC
jgi:hypothetical protein